MSYDPALAERIRTLIADVQGVSEKAMFGGLAFLVNGHMAVAAGSKGALMARVAPEETDAFVDGVHAFRMVMRGREMNGWIEVDSEGVGNDEDLQVWIDRGVAYTASLPPKR